MGNDESYWTGTRALLHRANYKQGKSFTISEELRRGRSQEVAMKAKVDVPNAELKVWCAQCCIRIGRNEERTVLNGKTYHTRCYSKLHPTSSKLKA